LRHDAILVGGRVLTAVTAEGPISARTTAA